MNSEVMDRRERPNLMYVKVTKITKTGAGHSATIKDARGILLTGEEVRNRKKEYIEELYGVDEKPKLADLRLETEVTVDEVRLSIKEMKKAVV